MRRKDGGEPRSTAAIARNRAKAKLGVYSSNQQPLISKEARKKAADAAKKAAAAANKSAKKVVISKRPYTLVGTIKF